MALFLSLFCDTKALSTLCIIQFNSIEQNMLKLIWLLIKEKLDKGTICDVEQLSQEFMKQIDKVKPKKKSAKKPESILYKA